MAGQRLVVFALLQVVLLQQSFELFSASEMKTVGLRRQRSPTAAVVAGRPGGGGGWHDLDYGNLTNAIRDIVAATTIDCSLAIHTGVETFGRYASSSGRWTAHVLLYLYYSYFPQIRRNNLMSRNVLYVFLWLRSSVSRTFRSGISEALRVCVITSPRPGFYQIYYSQATANAKHGSELKMVNWWSAVDGLVRFPLLPSPKRVYSNFEGRRFIVPVLHKPPWMFVEYLNDSFRVDGGRDDKLINLLANKLNFRFTYIDPPDRTQGSGLDRGSSMQGVLGLIRRRNKISDWFVGDLSITYERNLVVDFSFLTLVDNEAFLTHAPGRLNEAFSLIRPFHWSVWPLLLMTVIFAGPILYALIDSTDGHPKGKSMLYWKCVWWSVTVFLQQAAIIPSNNCKIRFVAGLLMLSGTYVIGDMYSASLTSILARPPKEPPINTLFELSKAMRDSGLQLLVEAQSASQTMLENGTGVYEDLSMLVTRQREYLIESTEKGMQLVRDNKNYAIIGGRETFYYDIKRFGAQHFHLSEKLNTRYSAIAFQQASPYRENFDDALMQLFEGGILSKITEEEYQKLNDKLMGSENYDAEYVAIEPVLEGAQESRQDDDDRRLTTAMSMKTLQGAFYVLAIGSILAGLLLFIEVRSYGKLRNDKRMKRERLLANNKTRFIQLELPPSKASNNKFQNRFYNI
ncbi:Ionotropic glutamate receptor, L-glutamate and glycine-binding domain,Ionotropic glutamate receptor [Cinara cedri]|uniref:Ionotropic glutamate receptor, L-glutamate and glycine-binding domain,Ionotropic glutamate receptor n=1 Tax=Cinara cedri TaxID=506608 RepID=A0A5E4N5U3_9HEMI|nr:Ionotropic glutamate receptor, L-glutamate and glycine-binding domain,Ionotropic glutamate receptor [Cinara cedri]